MIQAADLGLIREIQAKMRGFEESMIYHIVALFGLADAVAERPRTVRELALDLELNYGHLLDLFTYLTSIGLFSEDENGTITNSPASEIFRKDHPSHTCYLAQFLVESVLPAWQKMPTIVKTGLNPSRDRFNPATERSDRMTELFNKGMLAIGYGRDELGAILDALDFSQFGSLIDVGGGGGDFAQRLHETHPEIRVGLFDQPLTEPNVIVSDSVERVFGDFFETIPGGFAAYFWKRVFHDFSDKEGIQLLRLNRSIAPTAQVIICEMILARDGTPSIEKRWSLLMRVVTSGRERTLGDWKELIEAADYQLVKVVPTDSPMNLLLLEPKPA